MAGWQAACIYSDILIPLKKEEAARDGKRPELPYQAAKNPCNASRSISGTA
jgi:hypothetical protein